MRGIIVYETAEIQRNQGFIDLWLKEAENRKISLFLVRMEDIAFGLKSNRPFFSVKGEDILPDFAVMRLKKPLLSRHLESMGVRVYNSAKTSEILNDKRRTHALFQNIAPMLDTAFIEGDSPSPFSFPVVVKAAGGCGGRQVRLCGDEYAYRAALKDFDFTAVVQPLCDNPGRDIRIYMLGNVPLRAMLRYSDNEDFRSNFGIHHLAKPIDIPPEAEKIARHVAETLHSTLIGVDFLFDHGRLVFNEAEDAVGTRMLYQYTNLNVVSLYMDKILND